ncbi:MAG: hypothetical protein RL204_2417 [Bacteroidota bacterium]
MGMYARTKSVASNQRGEGSIMTIIIPPIINTIPMAIAIIILDVAAIFAAMKAPTNVPKA